MNTVRSLLQKASILLFSSGIENSIRDSEIIMQYVLNEGMEFLIANYDNYVSKVQEENFWRLVRQRFNRCPVSQIIGKRSFWDAEFKVNSDVLDPRSDSETLIESAISQNIYKNKHRNFFIADFGTGSGCLLISLLNHFHNANGIGFEKCPKAYRLAKENIKNNNLGKRAKVLLSSWNKCRFTFDLIVSNPPYIKRRKIKDLQLDVQLYEPRIALDGGSVGLEYYIEIFKLIRRCLIPKGIAILEIGEDQEQIHNIVFKYGLKFCTYTKDLLGRKRCIILCKNIARS